MFKMNRVGLMISICCLLCCLIFEVSANSNDVMAVYFPTNILLGMSKGDVATHRSKAVDSIISFSGTNAPSPKMLEPVALLGNRGMYWYHFRDDILRAMTCSLVSGVDTNTISDQIDAGGFSYISSVEFLRWSGVGTNLDVLAVDVWAKTNESTRLCSAVRSNETTLILYQNDFFAVSNFFVSASQIADMQSVLGGIMSTNTP